MAFELDGLLGKDAPEMTLDSLASDLTRFFTAQADLNEIRHGREGALMGAIGAGDSLLRTAEGIGEQRPRPPVGA